MNDSTDRTPPEAQQDVRQNADRPDVTRQDATVGVVEAAQLLGVTTDAVRARLRRGTLEGHKVEGEWLVTIPGGLGNRQDATDSQQDATANQRDAAEHRQDGPTERDRTPTVDLAPLTHLIDDLTKRNADLAASTAFWQVRALQAEEQLKAITAGNDVTAEEPELELAQEGPGSPRTNESKPAGIAAWWKRFWSG